MTAKLMGLKHMEEIFELLKKNGLEDDTIIEYKLMHLWSLNEIYHFINNFNGIVNKQKLNKDISPFSFMPNSHLSAQHSYCPSWDCRLNRIDELSRFSAFYADLVYLPNYLSGSEHFTTTTNKSREYNENDFRYNFVGDIKILNKLKPLLLNGIAKFIPQTVVADESKTILELDDIDKRFQNNLGKLIQKCSSHLKATLRLSSEIQGTGYKIEITSPDDFFEHGKAEMHFAESGLPIILHNKVRNLSKNDLMNGVVLSKQEIKDSYLGYFGIERIIDDLCLKHFLCKTSNLDIKYLTDREIDASS